MDHIESEIDRWFAETTYAVDTKKRYRRSLRLITQELGDLRDLTPLELHEWLSGRGWSNATQWVTLNAVKGFIRWAYGPDHQALLLKLPRCESPPQPVLKPAQVERLLASFDTSAPKGRRDLAMCTLFLDTGLRVAEVCRLERRYLDLDELSLQVIVKGGGWRTAWYSPITATYLSTWMADRAKIVRPGVRTVFVSLEHAHQGLPLTVDGLQCAIRRWGEVAGIGPISPHRFRRYFATAATRAGECHQEQHDRLQDKVQVNIDKVPRKRYKERNRRTYDGA